MYYISELSKKLNINQDTIRYYEKLELIRPKRAENGYRIYSNEDSIRIQQILLIKEMGYTLLEIKGYFHNLDIGKVSEEKLIEYFDLKLELLYNEKEELEKKIEKIKLKRTRVINNEYCVEENFYK